MINKHAKGTRIESLAKKILESEGYIVEKKNWNKFAVKDFFGCFDYVALKGNETRWIQVKSNKADVSKAKKKIKEWISLNGIKNPPHSCEIWLWITKDQFTIFPIDK